jgi:hypothetical protein
MNFTKSLPRTRISLNIKIKNVIILIKYIYQTIFEFVSFLNFKQHAPKYASDMASRYVKTFSQINCDLKRFRMHSSFIFNV